jgi:hypothetical protein
MEYTWIVKLVPNRVAESSKPISIAVVETTDVVYDVERVVNEIVESGSSTDRDSAIGLINRYLAQCERIVLQGNAVQLGDLIKVWGKVTGNWVGRDSYTKGEHEQTLAVSVPYAFKKKLKKVKVEVRRREQKDDSAAIWDVINRAGGEKYNSITPGDNIVIRGNRIKVAGYPQEKDEMEPGMGVFFVAANGQATQAVRIDSNTASEVEARVPPTLPKGKTYTLQIVTRYAGSNLLKEPRTINAPYPLVTD